jgi:outer membrane protein OmpA-like peptidoglycan-associated protein
MNRATNLAVIGLALRARQTRRARSSSDQAESATGWIPLRDILFEHDTAEIRPSEMSKISGIAAYVNQNPSIQIGIDGSTDLLRGTRRRRNTALSHRRISNVRDALIRIGVSPEQIETGRFAADRFAGNGSSEAGSRREGRVAVMVRST